MQNINIDEEKTKLFINKRAESSRKYYYENKEKVNLQQKAYREKNAIQEKQRKAKWYRENKERIKAHQQQYMEDRGNALRRKRYRDNPEGRKEYFKNWKKNMSQEKKEQYAKVMKDWRKNNPDKIKAYNRKQYLKRKDNDK